MRNQISKPEYALLAMSVAQRLAGRDRDPTARQLAEGEKQARAAVVKRGVGVRGGTAQVSRFLTRVRDGLSGITGMGGEEIGSFWDKAKSVVIAAVTKVSPFAPFLSPSLKLAVPISKIILSRQSAKKDDRAAAREDKGDGMQEVSGESIARAYDRAMTALSGDSSIPHDVYRAGVIQRARKLDGSRSPSTKAIAAAQRSVDATLAKNGMHVSVPGAQPGRVTR